MNETCHEIIDTIDKELIPLSKDATSKVFYLKMKGDYYRYIAEYNHGTDKEDIIK